MQFNEQQNQVINYKNGNCVVLAGAGSGKSTCLVNRIKSLIDDGVDENDIMTITFTKGSSEDLKKKLSKLNIDNIRVGTYHSICMKILREEGHVLDNQLKDYEYQNVFKEINGGKLPKWKDIMTFIGYQKNNMVGIDDEFIGVCSDYSDTELRKYYKAYEKLKNDKNCFDFDDLLLWTYDVLVNDNSKYTCKYLLVDEAQDNNLVQNMMLTLLCPDNNIMLIGDFRQSIYSFRGSRPELFMDFNKLLNNCSVINLDTNYRSKSNIVKNANNFISKYYGKYEYYSDSIPNSKSNGQVNFIDELSSENEAESVVDEIDKLLKNGVKPSEICVLYRLNSQSNNVETELKTRGIEYDIENNNNFFKRKEIDIILCMLRLVSNPSDNDAYETLFRNKVISQFLPFKLLETIKKNSATLNISYLEASEIVRTDKPYQSKTLKDFSNVINKLTRQHNSKTKLLKLVENIIEVTNLENIIEDTYGSDSEIEDRLKSIDNFKKFIRDNTLDSFLKFVYEKSPSKKSGDRNKIKLMTLHKSKGLEFDNVFLIGVDDGKFPNIKADLYDEARLMYVGVTRAKERLWISSSVPSDFVDDYKDKL